MIPRSAQSWQTGTWKKNLARAVHDPAELAAIVGLDPQAVAGAHRADALFRLKVPRGFLDRVQHPSAADPLLRQVLPSSEELRPTPGFGTDPLAEGTAMPVPGLLHKYPGRALLLVTGACPVHCRYCFRRHFPYADASPGRDTWEPALEYLADDPRIHEVILSGGDPLSASDSRLAWLGARIAAIPHIGRLRVHTRMPVVLPERVCPELLDWLTGTRLQPVVVIHCNHPAEIDTAVTAGLRRLAEARITLLNQSVLLRGVNDSAATLAALSERLFDCGVLPYYLHLLDKVDGAAHFMVGEKEAAALHSMLRDRLPGYLVPRLVLERPGASSKVPVA